MQKSLFFILLFVSCHGLIAQWDKVYKEKEGLRLVMKQEKYGFIDQSDKLITELKYEDAFDFKNGYAMVKSNGKFGFIDKTGKEITDCKFDKAFNFGSGYAKVYLNGKIAYINASGDYFWLATPFEKSYKPKEGIALLMNKGKYAYCNQEGKLLTGYDFDDAFDFRDGMGLVKIGEKMGYVDKSGTLKIPATYDKAEGFKGGKAKIIKDGRSGYIDKTGKEFFGYQLGQYLEKEGGIVIKLDESGFHGLVMALENATDDGREKLGSLYDTPYMLDFPHNKLEGWRLPTEKEFERFCKVRRSIEKYVRDQRKVSIFRFRLRDDIWLGDTKNGYHYSYRINNEGLCIVRHLTKTGEQYYVRYVREF